VDGRFLITEPLGDRQRDAPFPDGLVEIAVEHEEVRGPAPHGKSGRGSGERLDERQRLAYGHLTLRILARIDQ
jgi:hypothetical protein